MLKYFQFKYKNSGNTNFAYQKKGSFYMLKILIAAMVTLSIITACGRDDGNVPTPSPSATDNANDIANSVGDAVGDVEKGVGDAINGAGDAVKGVGNAARDAGNSMKNMR